MKIAEVVSSKIIARNIDAGLPKNATRNEAQIGDMSNPHFTNLLQFCSPTDADKSQ